MKRNLLTPAQAAWLAHTFDRNRAVFGGWSMTATPPEPPPDGTPAAPQEPAAAAPEAPKPSEPARVAANPWDDPKAAQAEIERLRKENGKERTTAKATAADEARKELAQTIGKALGLVKDEPIDPAKLTESLTASQAEAKNARVELAVFKAAPAVNGDPAALLDSTSFLASLNDVDPSDTAAVQAAITAAVEANPRLGAASGVRLPAPNPAQGTSGAGTPDPAALIAAAREKGDWQTVIALENQKLATP